MAARIEFIVLFILFPVCAFFSSFRIPKIPVLLLMTLLCLTMPLRDSRFSRKALWYHAPLKGYLRILLGRAVTVTPALFLIAWLLSPETLFIFLRTGPLSGAS